MLFKHHRNQDRKQQNCLDSSQKRWLHHIDLCVFLCPFLSGDTWLVSLLIGLGPPSTGGQMVRGELEESLVEGAEEDRKSFVVCQVGNSQHDLKCRTPSSFHSAPEWPCHAGGGRFGLGFGGFCKPNCNNDTSCCWGYFETWSCPPSWHATPFTFISAFCSFLTTHTMWPCHYRFPILLPVSYFSSSF